MSVTIEHIATEFNGSGAATNNIFLNFVRSFTTASGASIVRSAPALLFNEVDAGQLYVEEVAANGAMLIGNRFQGWTADEVPPIRVIGHDSQIIGNQISGGGTLTAPSILIEDDGASAVRWMVTGNVLDSHIDSSGSAGSNRFAANYTNNATNANAFHGSDLTAATG